MAKRKLEAACGQRHDWAGLFVRLDTDHGGSLDQEEFRTGLRKVARIPANLLDDSDIKNLFCAIDDDGNGAISAPEFHSFMTQSSAGHDWELVSGPKPTLRDHKKRARMTEHGFWSGTATMAIPKSKLEVLDLSWNNLGRHLGGDPTKESKSNLVRTHRIKSFCTMLSAQSTDRAHIATAGKFWEVQIFRCCENCSRCSCFRCSNRQSTKSRVQQNDSIKVSESYIQKIFGEKEQQECSTVQGFHKRTND